MLKNTDRTDKLDPEVIGTINRKFCVPDTDKKYSPNKIETQFYTVDKDALEVLLNCRCRICRDIVDHRYIRSHGWIELVKSHFLKCRLYVGNNGVLDVFYRDQNLCVSCDGLSTYRTLDELGGGEKYISKCLESFFVGVEKL